MQNYLCWTKVKYLTDWLPSKYRRPSEVWPGLSSPSSDNVPATTSLCYIILTTNATRLLGGVMPSLYIMHTLVNWWILDKG